MTSDFLEVQLNPKISFGAKGGLGYTTTVITNPTRIETRFRLQSRGYWKMTIPFNIKSKSFIQEVTSFFSLVQGKVYGWRFRNYREYYTCIDNYSSGTIGKEPLIYSGGTTIQLIHTRNPGLGTSETVLIAKPDLNSYGGTSGTGEITLNLYKDGSGTPWPSSTNWSLDVTTGIITFASDQTGHTFEWEGYWDTPMRSDVDDQEASWDDLDIFNWDGIPILEINKLEW